jgi:hypothetical protein
VDRQVRDTDFKLAHSRHELCSNAKRAFLLGQLVEQRDRLEAKHFGWARWTERLTRWINGVRNWKGKKLPYTLGVLDVWLLLYLIDYFGAGQYVSARNVIDYVASLFTN